MWYPGSGVVPDGIDSDLCRLSYSVNSAYSDEMPLHCTSIRCSLFVKIPVLAFLGHKEVMNTYV